MGEIVGENSFGLDLETTTGLFLDPSLSPGYWAIPDHQVGVDMLDGWIDIATGEPRANYVFYMGSPDDLYNYGEVTEFSYKSNPSTNGWTVSGTDLLSSWMPAEPVQDRLNSLSVKIIGETTNGVLLDIEFAPSVDVTFPDGCEALPADQPIDVTWTLDNVVGSPGGIIDSVDIYFVPGGGAPEKLLVDGVNAGLGQYSWTPLASDITKEGKIRIVCHNVNDATHVGVNESEGVFVVLPSVMVAEFPIIAGNPDATSVIAIDLTHASELSDLNVVLDASNIGGASAVTLLDNGLYPDLVDGDNVYSSPLLTLNMPAGIDSVSIVALDAEQGCIIVDATVQVEFVNSLLKLSEAADKTGDLNTNLSGSPYSEIYFDTEFDTNQEQMLLISKENSSGSPQIFRQKPFLNEGTPDFEERTPFWFDSLPSIGSRGVNVADFDQGGDRDIFISNNGANPRLYINDSLSVQFVDATSTHFDAVGMEALKYSHVSAWGDYNCDGFIDLAVAGLGSAQSGYTLADFDANPAVGSHISLFRGYGNHFDLVTHTVFPDSITVLSMSWRDINDDDKPDLVIFGFNEIENNPLVYINNGRNAVIGDYTLSAAVPAWGVQGSVRSMAWIDFNHDLFPDIVVLTNDNPSRAKILENSGAGFSSLFTDTLSGLFETILVGDVQQDGQEDLCFSPSAGTPVFWTPPYFSEGSVPPMENLALTLGLKNSSVVSGQYLSGGVIADFNNDHDLDILLGWSSGQPFFYRNVRKSFDSAGVYQLGNDQPIVGEQNWLKVDLTSLGNSNRSCIGAKVVVREESTPFRQWMQVVDGGSGRGGQSPNQLHFGLGSYLNTVSVEVTWPLPQSPTTLTGLSVNQIVPVSEQTVMPTPCLTISSRSVKFLHNPFPGGSDWVFEWDTNVKGDLTKDEVTWRYQDGQPVGSECLGSYPGTLSWGDPDVEITVYYRNGSWRHHLVWKNQICSPSPCPFEFEATSGYDGCSVTTGTVLFGNFGVCISE